MMVMKEQLKKTFARYRRNVGTLFSFLPAIAQRVNVDSFCTRLIGGGGGALVSFEVIQYCTVDSP